MNSFLDQIEKDREAIETFPMEIKEGTKAMIRDYHEHAIDNKNNLIKSKMKEYEELLDNIKSELLKRKKELIPEGKDIDYDKMESHIRELREILIMQNTLSCWKDKLSLKEIILNVSDGAEMDLTKVNASIKKILDTFKDAGIPISKEDFKYSTYVYKYMETYLDETKGDEELKRVFEKLYWGCPDIIMHIRLSLRTLIRKHKAEIKKYIPAKINALCKELDVSEEEVFATYKKELIYAENTRRCDQITMAKKFLNKEAQPDDYLETSPIRQRIYNAHLNGREFGDLNEEDKKKFYRANEEIGNLVVELENYFFFKPYVDAVLKRLKDKYSYKGTVKNRLKEIAKEESNREKVVSKLFPRKTLFGVKEPTITPELLVKQNAVIKNISELYLELKKEEANEDIVASITESSSIIDVIRFIAGHYYFFTEVFESLAKEDETLNRDEVFDRLLDFAYNPFNQFIHKTCASEEFNPVDAIVKKYSMLGYSVQETELTDNIENLKADVEFIKTCISYDNSSLDFEDLVLINKIDKLGLE